MSVEDLKNELNLLKKQCEARKNTKKHCEGCPKNMDCGILCGLDEPDIFLEFVKNAEMMGLI